MTSFQVIPEVHCSSSLMTFTAGTIS